jgi:rsbT co-antagonist protein RsbR
MEHRMDDRQHDLTGAPPPADARPPGGHARSLGELLVALLDSSPSLIFLKDTSYRYIYANRKFAEMNNMSYAELIGKTDESFFPPESAAQLRADEAKVLRTRTAYAYEEAVRSHARLGYYSTVKLPVFDAEGELIGVGGFIVDITERKQQEIEQQKTIKAQQESLRELSTPLLPIADGVLAMPLIGVVDAARAAEILATLLRGITTHHAHTAILDVTGIRHIDRDIGRTLVDAALAARLVGARVVLTGISPEVAQTLVSLDVDLSGVTTLSTLAGGIAFALAR